MGSSSICLVASTSGGSVNRRFLESPLGERVTILGRAGPPPGAAASRPADDRGRETMKRLAVASLALAALTSCASVGNYLSDRGGDLLDSARMKLMFGFGLGVKVDATPFVQAGWIWHDSWALGLHNRAFGAWDEQVSSWGLLIGHHQEQTEGISHYSGSYGWNALDDFDWPGDGNAFIDSLSFRVQGMGLLIGIDAQLRLGELLIDFPLGIFGLDPSGDDD
jgi:hypothetical protein